MDFHISASVVTAAAQLNGHKQQQIKDMLIEMKARRNLTMG
jgi:hypothetical protein